MIPFLFALLLVLLAWRARRWILVALLVAFLAGCGDDPAPELAASVELQALHLTEAELTCTDDPTKPRKPPKGSAPAVWSAYYDALARWITDLQAAGASCRGALGLVHDRAYPPPGLVPEAAPAPVPAPQQEPTS